MAKKIVKKSVKVGPKIRRGAKGKSFSANLPEPLLKKFSALVKKHGLRRNDVLFGLVKSYVESAIETAKKDSAVLEA